MTTLSEDTLKRLMEASGNPILRDLIKLSLDRSEETRGLALQLVGTPEEKLAILLAELGQLAEHTALAYMVVTGDIEASKVEQMAGDDPRLNPVLLYTHAEQLISAMRLKEYIKAAIRGEDPFRGFPADKRDAAKEAAMKARYERAATGAGIVKNPLPTI